MDTRLRHGLLNCLGAVAVSLFPVALWAQAPDSLPPGVTPAMVTRGKQVFTGTGLCLACHGTDGKGTIGPDLTDRTWLHHDGSYERLVPLILSGIDDRTSKTGQIMPPKGGSGISEADVRAVAAYVWTLSRTTR